MALEIGHILNNIYRVVRLLGKGSMGNVYLVERVEDNKKFVVKELMFSKEASLNPEDAKEIFFREAEFMAEFDHPGIPKIYGAFSQDGRYYLAMDYMEGKTLEEIINSSEGPVDTYLAVKWTVSLCKILYYLHNCFKAPIVYRDLKPSNIIITPEDEVKLVDFGIARYYNPDKNTDTFSYGSPGYAAPEQYKGRGQSSPQTDVFALGVILFQMLTKYDPTLKPFTFPSMRDKNPSVSISLEKAVKRAIELDPMKRYLSIDDFREILDREIGFSSHEKSDHTSQKQTSYTSSARSTKNPQSGNFFANMMCGTILPITGYTLPASSYIVFIFILTAFDLSGIEGMGYYFTVLFYMFLLWLSVIVIFILMGYKNKLNVNPTALLVSWMIFACPCMTMGPNIPHGRSLGKLSGCESNLKKIATALELYSDEAGGYYPPDLEKLLLPGSGYVITPDVIRNVRDKIENNKTNELYRLENRRMSENRMRDELSEKGFTGDEIEIVISCAEKKEGQPYIKELPLCPSCKQSYTYEVSSEAHNYTLFCGKEKSHISTRWVGQDGNWPQYTPGEGIKLK